MSVFIALAAVLVAGALMFVVPPLISRRVSSHNLRSEVNAAVYRDQMRELESDVSAGTLAQDQYEKARVELEARVLQDIGVPDTPEAAPRRGRRAAIGAGLAVPLLAIGIYALVGAPEALSPEALAARNTPHDLTDSQVIAMVGRLAARLKEKPDDPEGWVMLGRSYLVLGRYEEAAGAYRTAVERIPNDGQLLADYADALAMAQGQRLQGEPEKIIARALAADPDNVKALALAGSAAFEKKDYPAAVKHWERVLSVAPPDSQIAHAVSASVTEARKLAGAAAPQPPAEAAAPGRSTVSGVVTLAPGLASKVAPTDTVFIYARAAEGPRVPLAVLRKPAGELPVKFTLDDSLAMAPNMKLSNFRKVIVGARISKTGNALPQPGDLQGASGAIDNGATGLKVVIDSEVH